MISYTCDLCGAEISDRPWRLEYAIDTYKGFASCDSLKKKGEIQICEKCYISYPYDDGTVLMIAKAFTASISNHREKGE